MKIDLAKQQTLATILLLSRLKPENRPQQSKVINQNLLQQKTLGDEIRLGTTSKSTTYGLIFKHFSISNEVLPFQLRKPLTDRGETSAIICTAVKAHFLSPKLVSRLIL